MFYRNGEIIFKLVARSQADDYTFVIEVASVVHEIASYIIQNKKWYAIGLVMNQDRLVVYDGCYGMIYNTRYTVYSFYIVYLYINYISILFIYISCTKMKSVCVLLCKFF